MCMTSVRNILNKRQNGSTVTILPEQETHHLALFYWNQDLLHHALPQYIRCWKQALCIEHTHKWWCSFFPGSLYSRERLPSYPRGGAWLKPPEWQGSASLQMKPWHRVKSNRQQLGWVVPWSRHHPGSSACELWCSSFWQGCYTNHHPLLFFSPPPSFPARQQQQGLESFNPVNLLLC